MKRKVSGKKSKNATASNANKREAKIGLFYEKWGCLFSLFLLLISVLFWSYVLDDIGWILFWSFVCVVIIFVVYVCFLPEEKQEEETEDVIYGTGDIYCPNCGGTNVEASTDNHWLCLDCFHIWKWFE